ncbi:MAG: DUF1778 domain-containing protein [Streptosporangiaceae bacterium]
MTAAVERLGFRVAPSVKERLEDAARSIDMPLTEFVLGAAQDRADEVLEAKTVVPPDYFAKLLDALSAPAEENEPMRRAAARAPSVVEQRP